MLIAATKTTSFQPSAEVIELALVDTTGAVRLDRVMLPTGTITREAIAAHGLDRDELQRLRCAPLSATCTKRSRRPWPRLPWCWPTTRRLEHRRLYRTADGHERELPDVPWECVQVLYAEYSGSRAGKGDGLAPLDPEPGDAARGSAPPASRTCAPSATVARCSRLLQVITGSDVPDGR